ncbi:MAG TPA: hypothetical protein VIM30_18275 [Candidatus Limnocylindrales bacterium]|jgi:hypothetical protein
MPKFWSEVPAARMRELVADLSTVAWVSFWTVVAYRLFGWLASFVVVGRTVRQGGLNVQAAGAQLGAALGGAPLIGKGAADLARSAFGTAGAPFVEVGGQLENLILVIATVLTLLVAGITLVPWLTRYVPWRARRLARLRAAHRAIRRAPVFVADEAIQKLLASRAVHRLSYDELLVHSRDPLGDFVRGRYDRLARAELESVGLRPRRSRGR